MDPGTGLTGGVSQVLKILDCVSIDGGEGNGIRSAVLAGARCASCARQVEEEGSRDGEVVLSVTESKPPAAGEGEGK